VIFHDKSYNALNTVCLFCWSIPKQCWFFLINETVVRSRICDTCIWIVRTMQNVWYLNVSYKAEVVTFFVFRTRTNLWYLKLFALCRMFDIWLFRTLQNLWYLKCSYEQEVVTFLFFVRGTICDIFLLRTRREVVLKHKKCHNFCLVRNIQISHILHSTNNSNTCITNSTSYEKYSAIFFLA
jgi:hypothetical protein